MAAPDLLAYVVAVLLTVVTLLALTKDWKAYTQQVRWSLVILTLALGLANCVATYLNAREARVSEKRSKEIERLNRENLEKSDEIAKTSQSMADEQVRFEVELRAKNDEIAKLNREIVGSVTGGDSFCWVRGLGGFEGNMPIVVSTSGRHPLYDVSIEIARGVRRWEVENYPAPLLGSFVGRTVTLNLGSLQPQLVYSRPEKLPMSEEDRQFFQITIRARNGILYEELNLARVNGRWSQSVVVMSAGGKKLFKNVDKDFPKEELKKTPGG